MSKLVLNRNYSKKALEMHVRHVLNMPIPIDLIFKTLIDISPLILNIVFHFFLIENNTDRLRI